MYRILSILLLFLLLCSPVSAQWTLRQCIDYALEHNISLKQKENACRQRSLDVSTARNARLPDLNGGMSESFSFGRGLAADNTYVNRNTSSLGLQLSTSVPIFTGMRLPHQTRLAQLNLEAATADLEKASNDITLQVAQYFMQAIYNQELTAVAQRQVSIDSMQVSRLQRMYDAGKTSMAELSQQKASLAQSRLTLTQTINEWGMALLTLSQLLEMPSANGFTIVADTCQHDALTTIVSADDIFGQAVAIKPEIAAGMSRLKGAEQSVFIAKSALYPQLNLSGSIGSSYTNTKGIEMAGFGKQLKTNFNQIIGLSLNIPIFNRLQTRNSIRSAEIDRLNAQLAVDEARKALYKEVQQVCYNTVAAQEKYRSGEIALASSRAAFDLMKAKYENGKANITEFNEAKTGLMKSESELLRAKYELQYQLRLVDFYRGGQF